jgi:hypothetical protein
MSYGADFANADPANAPLDPVIMIGAEPTFWAAILLVIAAALLAGYFFGVRSNPHRADAARPIWQAISDAARSAMAADDNALKSRAGHLLKVVEGRLGKTLTLAKGLSRQVKKLEDALAARGPAHPGGGHGPVTAGGHSPDGSHGEPAPSGGGGGGGGGAATANITIVTGAAPEQTHSTGGHHGPAHDPHEMRDLTQREQTDALRLAVAAFNEHWRDETARVRELRAARAELSDPGPPPPPRPPARHISGTRAKH